MSPRTHGSGVFSRERYTGNAQAQHGASHDEESSPCFRHPDPQCSRPDRSFCSRSCCPGFMPSVAGTGKALPPAGNAAFSARLSALCASAASFPSVPRSRPAERVPCRRLRDAAPSRRPPEGGLRRMTSDRGKRPGSAFFPQKQGPEPSAQPAPMFRFPRPIRRRAQVRRACRRAGFFAWNAFFCRNGGPPPLNPPERSLPARSFLLPVPSHRPPLSGKLPQAASGSANLTPRPGTQPSSVR